ncbi:hypothetical protein F511_09234, partial [Dorcoceras hygrometricum]
QVLFHRFYRKKSFVGFNVKRVATGCNVHGNRGSTFDPNRKTSVEGEGIYLPCGHPHKFIPSYLATLETPPEIRQEACNLANDSLRITVYVRFKSEVVARDVVYAAALRFQVPPPENPPWWKVFDADKSWIEEICRVLAHLYSLPNARYIPVRKEGGSFATSNLSWDSPNQSVSKVASLLGTTTNED